MSDKLPKSAVNYQHPAKGHDYCGICKHFLAKEQACEIVAGWIREEDWCLKFSRKK